MTAIIVTAGSFGLMHLFHHGLAYTGEGLAGPRAVRIDLALARDLDRACCSASAASAADRWLAIASHAAFNIAMVIFVVFRRPR